MLVVYTFTLYACFVSVFKNVNFFNSLTFTTCLFLLYFGSFV